MNDPTILDQLYPFFSSLFILPKTFESKLNYLPNGSLRLHSEPLLKNHYTEKCLRIKNLFQIISS